MKVIARGRNSGKTMEIIKESALTGSYILVRDHSEVEIIAQLAQQMNLSIPYPVTVSEMSLGRIQGTSLKRDGVLVDNAGQVLEQLIGTKINTLSVSIFELEDGESSLIEELKCTNDKSFDTWFERWYKKNDFPNMFKKSAQMGYSGYFIELRRTTPLPENEEYLNRRLRDPRTVIKLKEKLPGISIEFVKEQKTGVFGLKYTTEKLEFSWE